MLRVVAQATDRGRAEADRLMQEGAKKLQAISYARSAKAKLEASDQSELELEKLAKTQFQETDAK